MNKIFFTKLGNRPEKQLSDMAKNHEEVLEIVDAISEAIVDMYTVNPQHRSKNILKDLVTDCIDEMEELGEDEASPDADCELSWDNLKPLGDVEVTYYEHLDEPIEKSNPFGVVVNGGRSERNTDMISELASTQDELVDAVNDNNRLLAKLLSKLSE